MNFLKESKDGILALGALLILYGYFKFKKLNVKPQKQNRIAQSEHYKYLTRTFNQ